MKPKQIELLPGSDKSGSVYLRRADGCLCFLNRFDEFGAAATYATEVAGFLGVSVKEIF